jgi:hypothetical protein
MKHVKIIQYAPSDQARTVLQILRLRGESDQMCIDRLLGNLLSISYSQQNYEEHFGPQTRTQVRYTSPTSDDAANISVRASHRILACVAGGCDAPTTGQSPYCKKHDMRFKRHGDPAIVVKPGRKKKEVL